MLEQNHSTSAISYADSITSILEKQGLEECEIALWTLWCKGEAYEFKNQGHFAIEIYHQIIPVAEQKKYWGILAETYISLERAHEAIGRGIDAKRNLDIAQELIKKYDLASIRPRLSMRASSYYRIYIQNIDTAKHLARLAIDLGKQFDVVRPQSDGYMLLGMMETEPDKRIEHFSNAREIFDQHESFHGSMTMTNSIAGLYLDKKNLKKAEQEARKTFFYNKELSRINRDKGFYHYFGLRGAHSVLQRLFEQRNQMDSAYYHLGKVAHYTSKIQFSSNQEKINEIEIKYAVENEKSKAQKLSNQLKTSMMVIAIGGLGLLALGGLLFIIYGNRKKMRLQNELISSQNAKLQTANTNQGVLLSEVHHRVKNNLQNVISLIHLQEHRSSGVEEKQYLKDISNKIHSIALIHDQLYQEGEFEKIDISKYFEDLCSHFADLAQKNQKLFYEIDAKMLNLNIETMIPLGIICAELLTNTLKYAPALEKSLQISLIVSKNKDGRHELIYQDNGPGYPVGILNGEKTGMGMLLIKSMTRQLLGDFQLSNMPSGSMARIVFFEKHVSKI